MDIVKPSQMHSRSVVERYRCALRSVRSVAALRRVRVMFVTRSPRRFEHAVSPRLTVVVVAWSHGHMVAWWCALSLATDGIKIIPSYGGKVGEVALAQIVVALTSAIVLFSASKVGQSSAPSAPMPAMLPLCRNFSYMLCHSTYAAAVRRDTGGFGCGFQRGRGDGRTHMPLSWARGSGGSTMGWHAGSCWRCCRDELFLLLGRTIAQRPI